MIVFQWKFQSIYHKGIASQNNFALLICQKTDSFLFQLCLIFQVLIPIKVPFGFHFGFMVSHGVKDGEVLRQCTKQFSGSFQGGRIHPDHHVSGKKNGIGGIFLDFFQQSTILFAENASVKVCKNSKAHAFFYFRVMDFIGYSSKFFHKSP